MNIEKFFERRLFIKDGGWSIWGSDNVIFFYRKVGEKWVVFRVEINSGYISNVISKDIDVITLVVIDVIIVVVVIICKKLVLFKFIDIWEEL